MPASPIFEPEHAARAGSPTVIVQTQASAFRTWLFRCVTFALALSLLFNVGLFAAFHEYFSNTEPPTEKYHSGEKFAADKIAVLKLSGTIMPPFTERLIDQVKKAGEAKDVKGVLLSVDSPGGFVADSHQIYHELKKLSDQKPVFVQMKRMAASGGYYIAMGAGPKGRLFAEPTTWTGSIGVIIPRYDVSKLAEKFGVDSTPLKTGEFKDALSPFRPLTDSERKVWENILNQSFDQFVEVIDQNRENLASEQIRELATGQVYTAKDALAAGLIDAIGFEEDAIAALQSQLGLKSVRVVTYEHPATLADLLLGSMKVSAAPDSFRSLLESSVPRALYYCSWLPPLPE